MLRAKTQAGFFLQILELMAIRTLIHGANQPHHGPHDSTTHGRYISWWTTPDFHWRSALPPTVPWLWWVDDGSMGICLKGMWMIYHWIMVISWWFNGDFRDLWWSMVDFWWFINDLSLICGDLMVIFSDVWWFDMIWSWLIIAYAICTMFMLVGFNQQIDVDRDVVWSLHHQLESVRWIDLVQSHIDIHIHTHTHNNPSLYIVSNAAKWEYVQSKSVSHLLSLDGHRLMVFLSVQTQPKM